MNYTNESIIAAIIKDVYAYDDVSCEQLAVATDRLMRQFVTCKDCKHADNGCIVTQDGMTPRTNWFCADGERAV